MRNEPHNRPLKPDSSKRLRLLVEKLESRRLLAGLNVSVTVDGSVTGDWSTQSSQAAAGRVVYIDLDHNGQVDAGEPVAITNELGRAFFEGLAAGDYSIGLVTDNIVQRQLSPSTMQTSSILGVPVTSQWIIGDPSSSESVWGLSKDGILSLIRGSSDYNAPSNISILELGGEPTSMVQKSSTEAWIAFKVGSQSVLAVFNTSTRQLTNYFASGIETLSELTSNGNSVYGVMTGVDGTRLVSVVPTLSEVSLETVASGPFEQVATLGDKLVTTVRSGNGTLVQLRDSTGTILSTRRINGLASEIKTDAASTTIMAVTGEGVFALRPSGSSLRLVAQIAEATGPISIMGGRLVSLDRGQNGTITVWNTSTWQPISRLTIGPAAILDLVYSSASMQAFALTGNQLTTINIASADQATVVVGQDQVAEVAFAVQQLKPATPLEVRESVDLTTTENQSGQLDLRNEIVDAGQTLWYSVLTGPQHGRVQLDANGQMSYTPVSDFFGRDSFTIRVYDGQASADVLINWDVIEVNRPPTAMLVDLNTISESLPAGSVVGTVSVVDRNSTDSYRITTSDYRFSVVDGSLILNESLDFESGNTIELDLTAVDSIGQFSISSKATVHVDNVIEAPVGVALSGLSIKENVANVSVGKLFIISPDAEGAYEVTVDDPRFEVQGDDLILIEPLNFEQASAVPLKLTVIDRVHPGKQNTSSVELTVSNENDPPTQIVLSALDVQEKTPGAAVGQVSVVDEDGDNYQYFVSDNRFEVVDGVLRLSESSSLDRNLELNIQLSITAVSTQGARVVANFPLNVIQPPSPWQNPNNPVDVNNDGIISPRDAIHVINFLNENGPGMTPPLPSAGGEGGASTFLDVNGDGHITPIDALLIINALNKKSKAAASRTEGEGEGVDSELAVAQSQPTFGCQAWGSDEELRRRNNSAIDAELEKILDQLAIDVRRN